MFFYVVVSFLIVLLTVVILNVVVPSVFKTECLVFDMMRFHKYEEKRISKSDVPMLLNEIYTPLSITTLRKVTFSIAILNIWPSTYTNNT